METSKKLQWIKTVAIDGYLNDFAYSKKLRF